MFSLYLPQPVLDEMVLHIHEVEDDTKEVDEESEPEGGRVASVVYCHAT